MNTLVGMNRFIAVVALCAGWCGEVSAAEAAAEKPKAEGRPPAKISRDQNGNVVITLTEAARQGAGLQTTALGALQLQPELKAYGRVVDAVPLSSLVAELTAARAAAEASEGELKRLQVLSEQNNASARALQAAQAAAARDRAQVEAARLRVVGNWGPAIAGQKDLKTFAEGLAALSNALVQVSLPAGQRLENPPGTIRLRTLNRSEPIEGRLLGPAASVDPQLQTQGLMYLVAPNTAGLAPGGAVTATLALPGEPRQGVLIPEGAVVRYNGEGWVYRQSGERSYTRVQVPLAEPVEKGWFAQGDFKPEQIIVTTGAQLLLSEELKGSAEE